MSERQLATLTRRPPVDRQAALRLLIDVLVNGADEAPCRDSECWLRQAAADVSNALSVEQKRRVLQ